ncbi:NADPH-dependent F420 reductase [Streptomyces sp. ISL-100]|uniref:NADPH-dependent F420 reductase n=1 Tax=Streptomyces sp. ISL-100 TaxID=2819173 RepID=UPI001BE77B50|nr:NAD(P)-binding domain-containing protein [Streptomyces sp. ISL-100]MBT2398966.1 NAD(P)-binding domain-containing protein [Streptomyces sp. ISL-100]
MRIGMLGTGNMADALGTQWARAGHDVLVGGRSADRAAELAARIGGRAGTLREAAAFGDATLLAVPHDSVPAVLNEAAGADEGGDGGGVLRGRVLIDCTNAVGPGFVLTTQGGPGAAERIAAATGAHVVKAFNHCADSVWRLTPPAFADGPLAVPLCGDDERALETVRTLVRDMGCEPLAAGGLDRAVYVETATAFLIGLWVNGEDPRRMLPPLAAATA